MKFYERFQSYYNRIKGWEWSPEMKKIVQEINDSIPPAVAKAIFSYIESQYTNGEAYARGQLKTISEKLAEAVKD